MEKTLEQIGLTNTEAKVYLALLELGEAKTGEILKKANINSGRIYEILDSLQKKGLVSFITKKNIKIFKPSPPERINDYLDLEEEKLKEKRKDLRDKLSELKKKYNKKKDKTSVELFQGTQGQRTAYEILFKEANKDKNLYVYGVLPKQRYSKEILDTLEFFVYKKRKELNFKTHKLVSKEAKNEPFFKQDNSIRKFLPYTAFTSIQILGDITLITLEKEPVITILIHNKDIANDYREQFKILWKQAKNK